MSMTRVRMMSLSLVAAASLAACGGAEESEVPEALDKSAAKLARHQQATPKTLTLEKIGGFAHEGGEASAEITAFDPLSKRLFVVNGALGSVDVLDLSDPTAPSLVTSIPSSQFGADLGSINSVAIHDGIVALAVEAVPKTQPGIVAWLRASDLETLGSDSVGALPDMVVFTPDGKHLLVANEGEPGSYGQPDSVDPEGTVSIIDVQPLQPRARRLQRTVHSAGFGNWDGQIDALRATGVRIFGPGASVSQDLEPEYITVSDDSRTAWVTLQENNAVAEIDLKTKAVVAIRPLGYKDHQVAGMGMDASDEDAGTNTNSGAPIVRIAPVPVRGLYMPDAIASYRAADRTWLITANEGDAREYDGFEEEVRVRAHCSAGGLEPTVFASPVDSLFDSNLGRLRITSTPNGGYDGKNADGRCEALYSFGARSFSIWSTDMQRVYDSGDEFEQRTQALANVSFNASNTNNSLDSRSTAKGPEPEGVAVARFGQRSFAFIGLERVGGIMVYDVSNPMAPTHVTYINTREGELGDRGPEGLTVIAGEDSPDGQPLLVTGNESSGTTAIYRIALTY